MCAGLSCAIRGNVWEGWGALQSSHTAGVRLICATLCSISRQHVLKLFVYNTCVLEDSGFILLNSCI